MPCHRFELKFTLCWLPHRSNVGLSIKDILVAPEFSPWLFRFSTKSSYNIFLSSLNNSYASGQHYGMGKPDSSKRSARSRPTTISNLHVKIYPNSKQIKEKQGLFTYPCRHSFSQVFFLFIFFLSYVHTGVILFMSQPFVQLTQPSITDVIEKGLSDECMPGCV